MRGERNYNEGQGGTRESGCRSPVENQAQQCAAERKDRTKLARKTEREKGTNKTSENSLPPSSALTKLSSG